MKVRHTLFLALFGLVAGASSASSQVVVTMNAGLAHNCFVLAKVGTSPRDGVDVCTKALRQELLSLKDQAATHDNRGVMLDMLERYDEATEDFNTSIRLDPTLGDPQVNLGSNLIRKQRYDEALEHINTGLTLGMSFPHIGYYDRGIAEELLGRYKEAYFDFKKVLELEPNYPQATERLKDFVVTRKPASPS